ncbi:MAG: preprotein translocase subunit SecE [Actinobacteria bacterium HGW-Actinobacteria-7]|jgi:preprotein translocase subunit SecE|nr:MAG: preprotein translocase subunit SecE [Actinobacteria bacterium HGW-Actinobacteria-7]
MAKASTADGTMTIGDTGTKTKKSDKTKSGGAGKPAKPGVFARLAQYMRDVRSEMKRVVWPQRPEVLNSSMVVAVTLIFFAAFTFFTDAIVVWALGLLTGTGK